jgi:hypothetical protein
LSHLLPVLRKSVSKASRATCSWRLPTASRGKQIKGTITASLPSFYAGYKSVSRSFALRIL